MKKFSLFLAFAALTFNGCASDTKPEARLVGTGNQEIVVEETFGQGELESLANSGEDLSLNSSSEEYKRTYGRSTAPLYPVFFPFDSSAIDDSQIQNVNDDARYLNDNGGVKVVIEGNTDNRGTKEYNLALGEQRAQSVKRYLIRRGVSASRMTTVSFGDLRPLFYGNDEESWGKNRRADLVILK